MSNVVVLGIIILFVLMLGFPTNTVFGWWWESGDNSDDEIKALQDIIFQLEIKINELQNYNTNQDNEDVCFYIFADFYDLAYDLMFYAVIFNLNLNTNFDESHVPVELRDTMFSDMESLQADFTDNSCENYRYLLEDDEYLKWRLANLEYHNSLSLYHSEAFHQQSKVGQYLDEIEEHKDLIKFFLPLLFG